jgi:hypothetical protein
MSPAIQPLVSREGPRLLSGPEAVIAASRLRDLNTNQSLWPYPWLFPTKDAKKVMPFGVIRYAHLGTRLPGAHRVLFRAHPLDANVFASGRGYGARFG